MRGATETPGVKSSSIRMRSGSILMRAAWRYSSSRCADSGATVMTSRARALLHNAPLLRDKLRTVVVRRIAVDRVDVIQAALRRVLDHQRRPLNPEIRHAAVRRRPAPGEIGLWQIRLDLGHSRLRERIGDDARPLVHEVEQHGLLRG